MINYIVKNNTGHDGPSTVPPLPPIVPLTSAIICDHFKLVVLYTITNEIIENKFIWRPIYNKYLKYIIVKIISHVNVSINSTI